MEENVDRWQSIVARSNLVATAGEFIPKSQGVLQRSAYEHPGNSFSVSGQNSDYTNVCNQRVRGHTDEPDGTLAGCSGTSLSLPHSRRLQISNEASDSDKFSSESISRKSNIYFADNEEQKLTKFNSNKPSCSRWKRSELYNARDRGDRKFNAVGLGQDFEKDEDSQKYLYRSRQKSKYNGYNYSNYIKSYEKNGTVYFKNDNQCGGYPEYENMSWRRKERFNDSEPLYFPRNRYKQNSKVGSSFEMENASSIRSNSYKNGNKFRAKEYYYQKNVSVADVNTRIDGCENKNSVKTHNEVAEKTSQREHLIDLLTGGALECLVCCEMIFQNSSVWGCNNCYHILHLKCIIKWAKSSKSDFGWRCPACQNVTTKVPSEYYCFCGKVKDPEWNHHDCPHSCGEVCGKTHRKSCPHKCTLLCHPGPCPQCTATVKKNCGCQKTSKTIQCSSSEVVLCDNICGKELNCLIHYCAQKCHIEECEECKEVVAQDCFCGKEHREVKCTTEAIGVKNFCCGNICKKQLTCENHSCNLVCHEGECQKCQITPDLVKFCPCGKTELTSLKVEERKSCKDPIPTCDLICGKILVCSTNSENLHTCQSKCHEGPCPICPLETMVKCRCGHMGKMVPCAELNVLADYTRCDKRCSKKRSCGKHKCNQLCCTSIDHECPLPCNRLLQCGLHRCEETCHRGHCKPCLDASFEELSCECGAEVIYPPVPCGTRRPPCDRPCTRTHVCEHHPTHNCHSANQCPPCTVLTKKYCHGRHELRRTVPCHQESFSCGLPCAKEIDCGRHKCILPCHSGPCLKEGQPCVQPCTVPRPVCGHICGAPCHEGSCLADTPCKEKVRVTCECGHRFMTRACFDNAKEYQRIATAKLATKVADLQAGQSIDLNDVVSVSKKLSYKTLECNDECKLIDRNRRLAIALQIRNPDLSAKLTPRYSEYLKNWAKKDPRFCQMVHNKLTDLVQLAKQSKQKSRSYSFDPMNREKRHFVHEYCEHFGCESVAYDQEPKRNVVATALKDKSWLPSVSIIEFVQKENSPRKVPVPVFAKTVASTSRRAMEVLPSKILPNHQSELAEGTTGGSNCNKEPQIDYFDWRPHNS